MKFTIYTPFYNFLDCAEDLTQSILNQTYSNWEWLITDDFSENPEVQLKLEEIEKRDERIKIIKSNWKKQYYYNIPVEYSSGDIILKIDSDDIPSVKLLEVYKYNYEKFPDVVSIGSSSIFKKDSHNGEVVGAKYINYKNTSNYIEANRFGVTSIIGDARSYKISELKNNGVFVEENDFKFHRGEDMHKILHVEEWGKFFVLPRILYNYTMRDDSNSGALTVHVSLRDSENRRQAVFTEKNICDAELRVDRMNLFSIEKFYDSSFHHNKNFYFSGLENDVKRSKVEYWSNKLGIEDMKKINDLYFDRDLYHNEHCLNPDYIIIDAFDDMNIIKNVLENRLINDCLIVINSEEIDSELVGNQILSLGYGYWFVVFKYASFRIQT